MGQTYYNILTIKVEDEKGAINALQGEISEEAQERARESGIDTATLRGLLQVIYGDWSRGYELTEDPKTMKGFTKYTSGFDAAYYWETRMIEIFNTIAPFLADRSSLKIYPDSGVDYMRVKDGKAEWIR